MKVQNMTKKFAACTLAGAMMVSMAGMSAAAAGLTTGSVEKPVTSVGISKVITTDGNTYAPNTSFTFKVAPYTPAQGTADTWNNQAVKPGIAGGLTGTTISSTPGSSTAASYTFSGNLAVDGSKFTVPGIYHYVVTEETPSDKYEGIVYSSESYDVYVFVKNKSTVSGQTNDTYVYAVEVVKDKTKSDLTFTNDYGQETTNDSTHDITVTKKIAGEFANMGDTFNFTVKVSGATGEKYKVLYSTNGISSAETSVTSGNTGITVSGIGNNGYIKLYGLTASDTYTITENEANQNGYTTTNGTLTGTLSADGTTATVTNTKNAATPTGIAMDVAPYVLMVAAAGGFAVLKKRK